MARIRVVHESTELSFTQINDDGAAAFLAKIDEAFRERGGFWMGLPGQDDAVVWVARTAVVNAFFDGDTPDVVQDMLIARTSSQ